jgi:hypothetical protein
MDFGVPAVLVVSVMHRSTPPPRAPCNEMRARDARLAQSLLLAGLHDRLDQRFLLLTRAAAPRWNSSRRPRAAVGLSYALTSAEQVLLGRLSAFASGLRPGRRRGVRVRPSPEPGSTPDTICDALTHPITSPRSSGTSAHHA